MCDRSIFSFPNIPPSQDQEAYLNMILNQLYEADDIQPLLYLEIGRADLGDLRTTWNGYLNLKTVFSFLIIFSLHTIKHTASMFEN